MIEPNERKDALDELRAGLPIDITALHLEAKEQPGLAEKAGRLAADVKAEAKLAKMRYEVAEAEAEQDIRRDPDSHGLAKVTESAVKSAVVIHASVLAAREAQIEAEKEADMAAAIANAYEHRRSSLKVEAELYKSNYWGGDVDDLGPARESGVSQAEAGVGKARERRRRRAVDGD